MNNIIRLSRLFGYPNTDTQGRVQSCSDNGGSTVLCTEIFKMIYKL